MANHLKVINMMRPCSSSRALLTKINETLAPTKNKVLSSTDQISSVVPARTPVSTVSGEDRTVHGREKKPLGILGSVVVLADAPVPN